MVSQPLWLYPVFIRLIRVKGCDHVSTVANDMNESTAVPEVGKDLFKEQDISRCLLAPVAAFCRNRMYGKMVTKPLNLQFRKLTRTAIVGSGTKRLCFIGDHADLSMTGQNGLQQRGSRACTAANNQGATAAKVLLIRWESGLPESFRNTHVQPLPGRPRNRLLLHVIISICLSSQAKSRLFLSPLLNGVHIRRIFQLLNRFTCICKGRKCHSHHADYRNKHQAHEQLSPQS